MLSFKKKSYLAYTLLELLVVLGIFSVIGGMTFASFDGLQNTVKMNEYMLNLEQDIRAVQRSSMLLERDPDELWLYGLGIDFSEIDSTGKYTIFKWCSAYSNYGEIKTKSELPAYDPNIEVGLLGNAYLPTTEVSSESKCTIGDTLVILAGYEVTVQPPKANIGTNQDIKFIVFESISGRSFFYNSSGQLINYREDAQPEDTVYDFELTVDPLGVGKTRTIIVGNLSGKISLSLGGTVEEVPEDDGGDDEPPSGPPPISPV